MEAIGIRAFDTLNDVAPRLPFWDDLADYFDEIRHGDRGSIQIPGKPQPIPLATALLVPESVLADARTAVGHIRNETKPSWGGKWGDTHSNREGYLPRVDESGVPVTYTEYYLPKSPGDSTRWGANRLVVGTDGKTYLSTTHYGQRGNPPFVRIE